MRRIVAEGGRPVVVDLARPSCASGRVLVQAMHSTVSAGTEASILRRSLDPDAPDVEYPGEAPYRRPNIRRWMREAPEPTPPLPGRLSLGYSLAGRVIEVGSDVADVMPGDLVACAGSQDAHHAEIVAVSRSLVAPVPPEVTSQQAAFVTPGAVAAESVRRTDCRFGETVLVYGLGLLGVLAAQVARRAGLYVIALEISPERRRFARTLGFDHVHDPASDDISDRVMEATDGFGADAAILGLVSESSEPVNQALASTRRGGRVVGVGVFGMNFDRGAVFDRTYVQAIAFGAGRYDPWYEEGNVDYPINHVRWTENRTMAYFLRLLAEGAVSVDGLSETFALDDAQTAYDRLAAVDRPFTVQFRY
ncbi:MAG TPA: zinc-binding alcohol dehydrogenase [Acidimicrobiia bacterium]|nr:zinc-binding alcohol dehydrogenase [Acidimicrobiia bacterium]